MALLDADQRARGNAGFAGQRVLGEVPVQAMAGDAAAQFLQQGLVGNRVIEFHGRPLLSYYPVFARV